MGQIKEPLTTEIIAKKFDNQKFELVNYAIKLAEEMIRSGRDPRVKTDIRNRAVQVLAEIAGGKDRLDDVKEQKVVETGSIQISVSRSKNLTTNNV